MHNYFKRGILLQFVQILKKKPPGKSLTFSGLSVHMHLKAEVDHVCLVTILLQVFHICRIVILH